MTIDVLGCAMDNNIRTKQKRVLEERACKGIVHDNRDIFFVGDFYDLTDVAKPDQGICR